MCIAILLTYVGGQSLHTVIHFRKLTCVMLCSVELGLEHLLLHGRNILDKYC
jgi:hypothetical protein